MLKLDLHRTFKTRERTVEIHCKAEIASGITTALYGKSGVGKSTVLRMIAGLEQADKGFIHYNDEVWFDSAQKKNLPIPERNIGFVFQDFNLFPNMTVEGNLKYAMGKVISPEIMHLMEVTDLVKLMKSYPRQLSGGERQRVSIVRALCQKPELLLLDEPFSALDDDAIGDLIQEIRLIQEETNTTVVMVSHRKDVIFEMAQSVVHLKKDAKVLQGRPEELLQRKF